VNDSSCHPSIHLPTLPRDDPLDILKPPSYLVKSLTDTLISFVSYCLGSNVGDFDRTFFFLRGDLFLSGS
jgi:hypothetical protein